VTIEISPAVKLAFAAVVTRNFSEYAVYKNFMVEGLQSASLRACACDGKGLIQDERQFQALDLKKNRC